MSRTREDLVRVALRLLDAHGLADVTMRRLAAELGLQASALYHHVPSKQVLLGAVADEVLRLGARPRRATAWDDRVAEVAHELRDAMLAYRDGAELVSTVIAFGLGAGQPLEDLTVAIKLSRRGVDGTEDVHKPDLDALRARALVLYELKYVIQL